MEGRVEPGIHTVCACERIYGKGPVNVSVSELSHMTRSSTEAVTCSYSKQKN